LPSGRVFSRFEWGEYLSWSYTPAFLVFMDGRIDIIPDDVWNDYAAITCGQPDWQRILDDYRVDALILDVGYHARTGLLPHVQQSTVWQAAGQAGDAVLFVRQEPLAHTR